MTGTDTRPRTPDGARGEDRAESQQLRVEQAAELPEGSVGLSFRNQYSQPVWVVLIWGNLQCGPFAPFRKTGWYQVNPGATNVVWNIDLVSVGTTQPGVGGFTAVDAGPDGEWFRNIPGLHIFPVRQGAAFDQCLDDNTLCDGALEFVPLDFRADLAPWWQIVLGPNRSQLAVHNTHKP